MKKINLLIFATSLMFKLNSQVVLYENFTAPLNVGANGWNVQNLSSPTGTNATGWFQGDPTKFNAITGAAADYYAADMNSTANAGATNTISCWLITPTLNLVNGAIIQFAMKGYKLPVAKADRVQVYYSLDPGTNVGTTAGSATNTAGTFTTLVYDANPNLNANNFPQLWTVITKTLSGIATPTVGRLAFRYYLPNGGANGPNGNYMGLDEFRYSLPCARPIHFGDQNTPTPSCAGLPVLLGLTNVFPNNPITSMLWFTGATTNTTSVIQPSGLYEIWSLSESTPGCKSLDISLMFVNPTPTVSYVITPTLVCTAAPFTITASGATTYIYNLGSASTTLNPSVLIPPASGTSAQFTLTGSTNGCTAAQTVSVNLTPGPALTYSVNPANICSGSPFTLTASGANSYTYNLGSSNVTHNPATLLTPTVNALTNAQFTLTGTATNGCVGRQTITVSINPNPTVSISMSSSLACINKTLTISAIGATSYSWAGAITSTMSSLTYSTGNSAGVKQFTVYGTSPAGCQSAGVVQTLTVSLCTGINELTDNGSLSVYPNPFSNELHLDNFSGTVIIYNNLGQAVINIKAEDLKTVDTSALTTGVYIFTTEDNLGGKKNFRLIKN